MGKRQQKLARRLALLADAEEIDAADYAAALALARGAHTTTRKQRASAKRNLRRECAKLDRGRPVSKTERAVRKLRAEIADKVKQEQLRHELKDLRQKRRQLREAKRALSKDPFSIF